MGIPSYFSYIVKNHSNIIKKYTDFLITKKINNLYIDSNSIIYDALYQIKMEVYNKKEFENILLKKICEKIVEYINIIKPTDIVFIAFDGVAPFAKMEQQRNRRVKSVLERNILKEVQDKETLPWDKTAITPGTKFMTKMNKYVKSFFKKKEDVWGLKKIIVSGTDEVGEGEHKLFNYIKENDHSTKYTVVYGLDADLIMLSINHLPISKNIFLFRETPEFIKSIDKSLNPNESYILDIPLLAHYITEEMTNINKVKGETRLYDYIFICFLLGNDFLPHFPALNIRTNGIEYILNAYKNTIGNSVHRLTNGTEIYWKQFKKFVQYLSNNEYNYIVKEYKIRDKKESRAVDDPFKKYLLTPVYNRENEIYINPYEEYWEDRYYSTLFDIEPTYENIKKICINYLEGLEWTMKYYTKGCPDWQWKYKYSYPPLLYDLLKFIPVFNTTMISKNTNKAVHPYTLLAYVLPKECLNLLPKKIEKRLLKDKKELYPEEYDLHWDYCTYLWESHLKLPNVSIKELDSFIHSIL